MKWAIINISAETVLLLQATRFAEGIIQSHSGMKNRIFKALLRRNYWVSPLCCDFWWVSFSFFFSFSLCKIKYHTWISSHKYHTKSTYETDNGGLIAVNCGIKLYKWIRVIKQVWFISALRTHAECKGVAPPSLHTTNWKLRKFIETSYTYG